MFGKYPILFDSISKFQNLKEIFEKEYGNIFLFCDENTYSYCLPIIKKNLSDFSERKVLVLPPGEKNKNINTCKIAWKWLIENKAQRSDLIVNLGGGVICDLGGFIASTYKRGLRFIHIPTTLLSQVDASVGGKLGVNFQGYKNLLGCFGFPEAVIIYTEFINTLEDREYLSGFAELLKHALIEDEAQWDQLKRLNPIRDKKKILSYVENSINIKSKIVDSDPIEEGKRKKLNLGHTIGHAIESLYMTSTNTIKHGEAIALGIACEIFIAKKKNIFNEDENSMEILNYLKNIHPLISLKHVHNDILEIIQTDKKNNKKDSISFSLMKKPGEVVYDVQCSLDTVDKAIQEYEKFIIEKN